MTHSGTNIKGVEKPKEFGLLGQRDWLREPPPQSSDDMLPLVLIPINMTKYSLFPRIKFKFTLQLKMTFLNLNYYKII